MTRPELHGPKYTYERALNSELVIDVAGQEDVS